MKRWLLILFAILLPLQLGWAAVADYCGDAHHAELHAVHADAHELGDADDGSAAVDIDCGHCHGHLTALAPLGVELAAQDRRDAPCGGVVAATTARPGPRPERPQWSDLA